MDDLDSPTKFPGFRWERLLKRIASGKVTPFLGAGACAGILPLASEIASSWAAKADYPFSNADDLVSVSQYLAVMEDAIYPKEQIAEAFSKVHLPPEGDQIHCALAELPLPIYITTNYDNLMVEALRRANREPRQEYCRWRSALRRDSSIFDQRDGFKIDDLHKPLVYHLHGHLGNVNSLVISEDDYLEFLVEMKAETGQGGIVPVAIQRCITDSTLLFIGYRLADWNFRVLFHSLNARKTQEYGHVSVQLEPGGLSENQKRKALEYFEKHFGQKDIQVYWGDAKHFVSELLVQWRKFQRKLQPIAV